MKSSKDKYKRHRFPSIIIQHAVWLYYRFNLSYRHIEDLLAERGVTVSYEAVRLWCKKFGPQYAHHLKKKSRGFGDTFFIDEVFVMIQGKQHYLWRAVDQDGDVIDVFLQERRNSAAAKRFLERLIRSNGGAPRKIVTDKLGSYRVRLWFQQRVIGTSGKVRLTSEEQRQLSASRLILVWVMKLTCQHPISSERTIRSIDFSH